MATALRQALLLAGRTRLRLIPSLPPVAYQGEVPAYVPVRGTLYLTERLILGGTETITVSPGPATPPHQRTRAIYRVTVNAPLQPLPGSPAALVPDALADLWADTISQQFRPQDLTYDGRLVRIVAVSSDTARKDGADWLRTNVDVRCYTDFTSFT
jgi:hypothetical protein